MIEKFVGYVRPMIRWWRRCLFFVSSRRRHTRCYRDWSSDVCSSDLRACIPTNPPNKQTTKRFTARTTQSRLLRITYLTPNNPLASNPPPAPPCQGECSVCPSPDKGRLGGVGVEFLPNGQSGLKTESPHLVGRATPDAAGKARPSVNHLTVMNYVKLNSGLRPEWAA